MNSYTNSINLIKSLIYVGLFLSSLSIYSQINTYFDSSHGNYIGGFTDQSTYNSDWFSATQGNGTFSISNAGSYYGSASLKVDVNTDSPWQVRTYNRAGSYFNITNTGEYTVSFYAKGTVGNEFTVTLMDGSTDIETISQVVRLDEWTFYTLTLTSNVTSTNGRVKLNFLDQGTYEIDELIVKSGGFNTWYVSNGGSNSNSGNNTSSPFKTIGYAINNAWTSGDIIYVMDDGTPYRNNNYGSGFNNGQVVYINRAGTLNGPLVIRNYPGHTPKIEFDGSGGFISNQAEYLEISGFEIQGPNQQITQTTAEANRTTSDNFYKGRGIAIWAPSGGHHIILHSNKVYDCPASGIRINNSDYCVITNNEVYNCTTWSAAAESAIVLAQSKSIDSDAKIKMRITKNKVYDNVNKIHYYNSSYPCTDDTAYGCLNFPNIIDGSGCYITRNNDRLSGGADENPNGQYEGYFYFANNISYGNGINGLVVHKSDNSIVMNNTCYINGAVPISEGRQNAVGITVNNSVGVRLYNNIVWTEYTTDNGYQSFGTTSDIAGSNNILITGSNNIGALNSGMINLNTSDPLFVDQSTFDFRLSSLSNALDTGILESNISTLTGDMTGHEYTPFYDFENATRALTVTDIGAYESVDLNNNGTADHLETLSVDDINSNLTNKLYLYPNPATHSVMLSGISSSDEILVYDLLGKRYALIKHSENHPNSVELDVNHLKPGLYLIKVSNNIVSETVKLVKR